MIRAFIIWLCLAVPSWAEPVVIFAAASLKGPLDEIFAGEDVVISYGGSGAMAQQIAQGAPADVFISASSEWMDWLEDREAIDSATRRVLLSNGLVLVSAAPFDGSLEQAVSSGSLAMGQVDSVPVGQYGRQFLENVGLWDAVAATVVQLPSASAVTRLVSLGEVRFGITYYSEAKAMEFSYLAVLASNSHDPIHYPMAAVEGRGEVAATAIAALQSDEAGQVFSDHGFVWVPRP